MKKQLKETTQIPSGIDCSIEGKVITSKKNGISISRTLDLPTISMAVSDGMVVLSTKAGTKREFKVMRAFIAHLGNIFKGLENKYTYSLEACNVHFPMTLKVDKNELIITNFLGEKVPRKAKILPHVDIEIKGQKITLTSADKENAGQTAANIEKATKIKLRDRRIFQDGIYITSKPGEEA